MEVPVQNTEQTREERKANLLKDEEELLLRISLIERDIAQVQAELDKIHVAHYAISRAPFSPKKPEIVQGSIIMGAVRARMEEEENRKDQYHTSQTGQNREIRDDMLEITRKIDRDLAAVGKAKKDTTSETSQEQPVPRDQQELEVHEAGAGKVLRTDEGVWNANVLVTTRRDGLVRAKKEFERILKLTREQLEALDEEMVMELYEVGELKGAGLEEESEPRDT